MSTPQPTSESPQPTPEPPASLVVPPQVAAELSYLDSLEAWIPERRKWLLDSASAGRPEGGASAPAPATPGAARILLSAGVFALAAAALAFTAYSWTALGAVGQLAVLVLFGAAACAGGYALADRLPAAGTALAVAGVLLLVVAGGFLLDADTVGSAGLRSMTVNGAAAIGVALAYAQTRRQPGAAAVTASFSAVLALVSTAAAPYLGPGVQPTWAAWWVAGTLVLWGAVLLVLAALDGSEHRVRVPWAWFGVSGVVVGVLATAAVAADRLSSADVLTAAPAAAPALVLLTGSAALLGLDRVSKARWTVVVAGAVVLTGSTLLLLLSGVEDPSSRLWMAGVAVVSSPLLVAAALRVAARATNDPVRDVALRALGGLAAGAVGVGIGFSVAPLHDAPQNTVDCTTYLPCTEPTLTSWLSSGYPWERGALIAVAATLAAALVGLSVRRSRRVRDLTALPLVVGGAALGSWAAAARADAGHWLADGTVTRGAVTAALVLGGLGLITVLAAFRAPAWTLWVAAVPACAGASVGWALLALEERAAGPEARGLLVALPLLLVGVVVRARASEPGSTWTYAGPPLVALMLFPAAAMLAAVPDSSAEPVALTRAAGLVVVGAGMAVLGARARWAAPFWVGLAVVVVTAAAQAASAASQVPQWLSLSLVGGVLIAAGARWEWMLRSGRRTREWAEGLR